jgi:Poxvirus Late Transcription Factor VLTF3 like
MACKPVKRGRAVYGSKCVTDSQKRYRDELEYNDVESNIISRLELLYKRTRKGDPVAIKEEIRFSLLASAYLTRHCAAVDRDEQRLIYKEYLAEVDDIRETRHIAAVICTGCQDDQMQCNSGGVYICAKCGCSESPRCLYTKDDFETFGPQRAPRQQTYKPINHFNDMLIHFQGKELTEIPDGVMRYVQSLATTSYPHEAIGHSQVKQMLRLGGFSKYYSSIPSILAYVFGIPAPSFTENQILQLREMFEKTQVIFANLNIDRINFLSINYLLYKFCELLEWNEYIQFIQLLKSPEKVKEHDRVWKDVCGRAGWNFKRTRAVPRCLVA